MMKFLRTPSRRNPGSRRATCGFSLVELVVVVVVLSIVASAGALIMSRGLNTYFAGRDMTRADWNARLALERMTRDLREVGVSNVSAVLTPNIATMTANTIAYTDKNGNAVSYTLSGTTLQRNLTPLANNISAMRLSYWQRNGQSAAAVSSVVYYITVSAVATSYNNIAVTYHDTVRPRSFP